ncbi:MULTISPECIES: thiamine pyrophosphate-dependent dehydrogenase E1 component subunit alpha [Haloferax]|uniref:Pyruvate dehydrogenase (Acetyl-transferring) E1 component subunit alpha n=1 Tax=Haloferax marinum TaxID=2666143 RepID=A0A6A8G9I8_9EURY|nr:thiamine pyrophosphate-dependent dehydrogenase E1 component subunit alpha [Haloferax marinum]KAB1198622.1 thiamine pyrophosphate-dependent dehydrogenase E1 component subunit alpha [Haloferax sp. CBA1150]MRW97734.1 pyruvate dehydrogenase (acetyl-transferring) E1 component subunit alpha [Haloferax marinum]
MYEQMVTARYYEERLQEEYLVGKQPAFDISAGPIPGELHLAAGHESSGAGVCIHLRDDDTVTAPHRPHHIAIAKGVDLKKMTAEIFGRKTGLSKGKGGHMHLFDPDVNFACSGIIAQGCPPAVGAAMAAKKRHTDSVAVAFLGDGAINQGGFFESLNLASVQNLPVVFVIEDNDWAISMPKHRVTDVTDGSQRADGFTMPGERVDSDDAVAVYEAAGRAIARARDGNGPTLLEVQVHRRMGHFMGDAEAYRPESDISHSKRRDSIERLAEDLRAHGVEDDEIDEIRERAHERVDEAIAWAKEQPEPDPSEAYEDVFTNPPAQATTDGGYSDSGSTSDAAADGGEQ